MWKQYASPSTQAPTMAPGAIMSPKGPGAAWHPTVLYMLGLIAAEILFLAFISKHLLD